MDIPDDGALDAAILAAALDTAGVAVVVTDLELDEPGPRIQYVNATFEAMTGYAAHEALGRTPRMLQGPRTERDVLDRLRRCLEEKQRFIGEAYNYRKNGEEFRLEWTISAVHDARGEQTHWMALQREVGHQRATEEHQHQHRVRNLLATIRSIALRTLSDRSAAATFAGRLAALSRAQGLVSWTGRDEVDLDQLIRSELTAQHVPADRVTVCGSPVAITGTKVEMLALALHELTTNACLHGAFNEPMGRLKVTWSTRGSGADRRVELHWSEQEVEVPAENDRHRGHGFELLEVALPFSLRAVTRLTLLPGGLDCRIELPAAG
jgi:PAS domain S-box-containing protein